MLQSTEDQGVDKSVNGG